MRQAAGCGDLPFVRKSEDEQEFDNYEFKHDDLRRWANAHGFDWCIPESPAFINRPQTDAELLKQFQDVTSKNTTLGQEVERLQKQLQHHQDQTKTLTENAKLIGELQAENERLKAEFQQQKERPVGTRQLNTLLTIIAAACKHGKLDVRTHAKTAGVIRGGMAEMGVDVGETTIESYLKMIPEVIEQKASK